MCFCTARLVFVCVSYSQHRYTEGMDAVVTVRDFSLLYDAFAQFEESMISAKMAQQQEGGEEEDEDDDLDLRLCRLDHLISDRPALLNAVVLRQNPHDVGEWFKRVKILSSKEEEEEAR